MKKSLKALIIALSVVAVLAVGVLIYAGDYYRADENAALAMQSATEASGYTVFKGNGDIGLVFYPGGKVEASAYAPLLQALSEKGITCVLVEMPLNLAVLNQNGYKGAVAAVPEIDYWYIAGHSLGGAMASGVATGNFEGLILLAAYPTSKLNLPVLSIYGTNDGVMNREKYRQGLQLMPNLMEVVISGGNHACFGSYGEQSGDGIAEITPEEQIEQTVDAILSFIQ